MWVFILKLFALETFAFIYFSKLTFEWVLPKLRRVNQRNQYVTNFCLSLANSSSGRAVLVEQWNILWLSRFKWYRKAQLWIRTFSKPPDISTESSQVPGHMSSVVCYRGQHVHPHPCSVLLSLGLAQVMFPHKSCLTDILFPPTDVCLKVTTYAQVCGNGCKYLLKSTCGCLGLSQECVL